MQGCLLADKPANTIALIPVAEQDFAAWSQRQESSLRSWLAKTGFAAKPGSICPVPDAAGNIACVIAGINTPDDPWACGGLAFALPQNVYHIAADWDPVVLERAALGWALGAYRFSRYKKTEPARAKLVIDQTCDKKFIDNQVAAITLVRDLINTPPEDMMPLHLAQAAQTLADSFGAEVEQVVGDELLTRNFPAIHAVGRASIHAPRLIDLRWGDPQHPKLTLVGKGVCFDSGGLDLKSANNMRLMKKDMGGAAHALGLARMIMAADLPVRLRVLIAAVENAVAGNAFHPGDVLQSRQGLSIEIDNTDAEGRLILCDALAEGGAEEPDLMIDFATLTGAARVALGTDVPGFFCNTDQAAAGLLQTAAEVHDPIWRLPLHEPYRELLKSEIADLLNSAATPFGGAITAALFLKAFVPTGIDWVHFDLMAWNIRARPGRPEGGEAMGLRAVFGYLKRRFQH